MADPITLPSLPRGWYWEIAVGAGPDIHISIELHKTSRVLGLRNEIKHHGREYIILDHHKPLDGDDIAERIAKRANKIYDARFRQGWIVGTLASYFPEAKVKKS